MILWASRLYGKGGGRIRPPTRGRRFRSDFHTALSYLEETFIGTYVGDDDTSNIETGGGKQVLPPL